MALPKEHTELLNLLLEESAECIQATSKIFRFGWESCHPDTPLHTNKDHLEEEIGDLLCIIEILVTKKIISSDSVARAITAKIEKLKKYSKVKL